MTTMTTTKGADHHVKEELSEGRKYARRAKARRRIGVCQVLMLTH
jgi:hypothetical protein